MLLTYFIRAAEITLRIR